MGFPGGTVVKNPQANAKNTRDMDSTPGSGRSPRVRNSNPLQYSYLENSIYWESWEGLQLMGSQRVRHDWGCNTHSNILYIHISDCKSWNYEKAGWWNLLLCNLQLLIKTLSPHPSRCKYVKAQFCMCPSTPPSLTGLVHMLLSFCTEQYQEEKTGSI